MKRELFSTQIRIPSEFHAEISAIAKRDGLSLNAAMLMLIRLGLKVYEGSAVINLHPLDE